MKIGSSRKLGCIKIKSGYIPSYASENSFRMHFKMRRKILDEVIPFCLQRAAFRLIHLTLIVILAF